MLPLDLHELEVAVHRIEKRVILGVQVGVCSILTNSETLTIALRKADNLEVHSV